MNHIPICLLAAGSMLASISTASSASLVDAVVEQPVIERTFKPTSEGFGQVQASPANVISIDAPYDGTVSQVFVRPGQSVPANGPLAQMSPAPATQEAFTKAKTALDLARIKLSQEQYLWKKGATTKDALNQAQSAFGDAEAAMRALQRRGAGQSQQTLVAPKGGTVTTVQVVRGDQVSQNAKIATLAPGDALAVLLGVEPEDAGKVRLGMGVTLNPAFNPHRAFQGKVIALNDVVDPKTHLVNVLVALPPGGADAPMIGSQMRGEIALSETHATAVPTQALLYDSKGAFVFIDRNGRAVRTPVTREADGGGFTGVKGALKPGDHVVVQGNYELKDGMTIVQASRGVN